MSIFHLAYMIADYYALQVTNAIKFTRKENNRNIDVILAASTQRPDRSLNGTVYLDFPVTRGPEVEEAVISPNPDEVFIMITVKDTGCGIKMDELQNIFMRFQQSSPKTHGKRYRPEQLLGTLLTVLQ